MGKINYDSLVEQYFEMFHFYLDNLPEDKKQGFSDKVNHSFFNRYNCNFDLKEVLINLPYKEELRDFFVRKYSYINEYQLGFYYFNDLDYVDKIFSIDLISIDYNEVGTFVSRGLNTYKPNYTTRYNINDIISQFAHDVINKKDVDLNNRYKYSKKLILCFIYLSILTQFNKKYKLNVGSGIKFDHLFHSYLTNMKKTVVKKNGDIEEKTAEGDDITDYINKVTDCFSHISGNFIYVYDDNKMIFKNRYDTTIELDVDEFLNGMNNVFNVDILGLLPDGCNNLSDVINNGSINLLLDLVDKVIRNDFGSIENIQVMFLMSYLQLCFNQEGLCDNEIMSQYSLIDCSGFELDYGFDIDKKEFDTIELFKTHHLVFTDENSKNKMKEFFENCLPIDDPLRVNFNSADDKRSATLCDTSKMVFDKKNEIYIPSSEVIMHLRNSLRHGRYKIEGEKIHFWDQKNDNDKTRPSQVYFNLSIDCNKFLDFLSGNIINEVLYIEFTDLYKNEGTVNSYKENRKFNKFYMYESEMAYAKNSFKNYMDVLKTRFYDISLDEFMDILIDNNLLSRYLADNVDKFPEFLEYEIESGVKLVDYLKQNYNYDVIFDLDDLPKYLGHIDLLVEEIKRLIKFELDSKESEESIFFKLYYEYHYKKADIFMSDNQMPIEFKDKISYSKMHSEYYLSGIDYDKHYTQSSLLNLALFKHKEFNEFDRLSLLFANHCNLKHHFDSDEQVFRYENIMKHDNSVEMFADSARKVVKSVKLSRLHKKGIFAFKTIFSFGMVSGLWTLCSMGSYSFLSPPTFIFAVASLTYLGFFNSIVDEVDINDSKTRKNEFVTSRYIEESLENDDLFQRQVRRSKR